MARTLECGCEITSLGYCEESCALHVPCDLACRALVDPISVEDLRSALEHWRDHGALGGCSHGC